jgi:hypothetical protein
MGRWSRKEWQGIALIAGIALAFGAVVMFRSAFLHKRYSDLAVFLRAAWAVSQGLDLYAITDDKGLFYHYPPLLAILLIPLADPPGSARVVFALKAGLWYFLSVAVLLLAVHGLACALEKTSPILARQNATNRRRWWWALRLVPVLACLPHIGHVLGLGQVNTLWLALLCGMAAALLRKRSWRAGLFLAGAICLKVVPAFLLLYPLWRRDVRCLAGCAAGLFVGLAAIPVAALGPQRAWDSGHRWAEVLLKPALGLGGDQARQKDLLDITATHNQGLVTLFHDTLHLTDNPRPPQAAAATRLAGMAVGGLLTLVTLLAAGWRRTESPTAPVLFLGALTLNMLLLSPAGHAHYIALIIPLMMGILVALWERAGASYWDGRLLLLFAVNLLTSGVPLIVCWNVLYDVGVPMQGALVYWVVGNVLLWKMTHGRGRITAEQAAPTRAAA